MEQLAPVLYGKYQLLDLLARGGMAEVFKAKSHGVEGFEKILVIKRILPELSRNPQFVDMFINEAKIAVTLSHANIVQVFDLGRTDDTYFIAMEYVAGFDLATVLRRARKYDRPLPPELAVYIVSEVAKGLDYAHRRRDSQMRPLNIVHRDVSPQNVLLSWEGEVKLTDFGIAKARTTVETDTELGVLKGKYAYMAPEQAHGRDVDGRTDLYALGIVLFEALSGVNPFLGPSTYETLKRVREGRVPPLRQLASEIPEELATIVANAMSPDPESRHPNAGRLYEDLIQFLYSSGRRVGAHDLSRYIDELRVASEKGKRASDDSRLVAAFDVEGTSGIGHGPQEVTPAEVPSGRTSARRTPSGALQRPRAEQRDCTALAVLAAQNDPFQEASIRSLLRRFGGVLVDKGVAGDDEGEGRQLVALFGVKDPDGRDTEAAARCALRIARAAVYAGSPTAVETTIQIGIHAGRVLVDLAGQLIRDDRYDRLVRTARDAALRARYGQVLATLGTDSALRGSFDLAEDTDHPDGGMLLIGERDAADVYGKFVGRRDELRRVGEILALANKGRRRVIGISGEAGSGKTRLMLETMRRLRLGGHDVGMYVATCSRQNREVPIAGVHEMLRVILGIDEVDPDPVIREKVDRLRELGLSAIEQKAMALTLGLPVDGDAAIASGQRPLRSALVRMATKLAEDRLTVLAWDGVEAMDEESQALIDGLLRDTADARICVVLSYRPGLLHAWADLPGYHQIDLGPLPDDDVARLTAARLGAEEVPMELLREVTAKSGGNPLYVEEYLNALRDAGAVEVTGAKVAYQPDVAAVQVPKTLRGIVAARLARLTPTQRHILQVASVAGTRFSAAVVAHVVGEDPSEVASALALLERRGIVVKQGTSEHAFAHELVGEVLREGLTLEARREIHGSVAATLEELHPQRVDEMAERLAHHWREAGERGRAVDYLVRAADRLESEHALEGAIQNLAKAIDMLSASATVDRDRVLSLHRRIGDLSFRGRLLEQGAERMGAALELAEGLGRDEYVARFAMMRGRLLAHANRFTEGQRWLDRAREMARRIGNSELLRDVTLATAEATTKNGEYAKSIGFLREALEISRETGDVQAQIRCLIPLAMAYAGSVDRQNAFEALDEARQLAGAHPDRWTECELYKTEGLVHHFFGDHDKVIDASSRALELAKEYGFTYEIAVCAHNIGESHMRLGDYKRAFAMLRYSYEVAREAGFTKLEHNNMRVLGFIDAVKFGSPEGRARVVEACDYAEKNGFIWDLIQAKHMLALIDHMQGDHEGARRGLREVLRLSAEYGQRHYEEEAEQALRAIDAGEPVPLPG